MPDPRVLRRIQSAPDVTVRQEYVVEEGRKRLDHVVWSSTSLGLEQRVDIQQSIEPLYEEPVSDGASDGDESTTRTASRGRRERKE